MKKKINFNYPDELAVALRKGRKFTKTNGDNLFYDESKENPFRVITTLSQKEHCINSLWKDYNALYEEVEPVWPKDFKPCWCWVSDRDPKIRRIKDFILTYDPEKEYPFIGQFNSWAMSTPMSESEVINLCWSKQIENESGI